jgi:hypothetical protein
VIATARRWADRLFGGGWFSTLLLGGVIVLLSWPYTQTVQVGVDESWRAALHVIGPTGQRFGEDIVFTYGPLGFLSVPWPFFGPSSALATIATGAVYLAAATTLLVLVRRLLPGWAAALVVFLTARATFGWLPPFEMLQALIFVWSVEAVLARRLPVPADWLIVGSGILAAVVIMGKTNVGVFSAAMLFVASIAIARPRWRGAAIFAGVTVIGCLVVWVVTGQALTALPAFVAGAIEIVRGYSEAMVRDTAPEVLWLYPAYVAGIAIFASLGWQATRGRPRSVRLAVLAIGALIAFAEWKTAFTRNYTYYARATALLALFPLASRLPNVTWGRSIAGAAYAAMLVVLLVTQQFLPTQLIGGRRSASNAVSMAAAVLPWRQEAAVEATRSALREELALPPEILAELTGQTVHIDGWQSIVAFAYPEFRWSPLPVFQSYSAYTTALDELNAARLRGAEAPERILRERFDDVDGTPRAVDKRFIWFEPPAATLEMLCRYDELVATDRWQVLGRTDRTCAAAEVISTMTALAGERVTVPTETRPDRFVIVRISGFPDGIGDRVRATLLRADEWYVEVGDRGTYRFVPGTAGDGLVVAVPAGLAFHPRFAFGPPVASLTVSAGRDGTSSDAMLRYEFLSVPWPPGPLSSIHAIRRAT